MKIDKNFLIILIGRVIQAAVSVFTIRLMTTLLSKNEIGSQYVINSIIFGFSLVLINPFGMYINRHIHEWQKNNQLIQLLKKINLYFLGIAIVSIPIVFFIKEVLLIAENQQTALIIGLVAGFVYLSTWFQTLTSFFNLFNRQKQFIILNITSQVLGLALAFGFVQIFSAQTFFWLLGLLVGQFLGLLLGLYFLKKSKYFGSGYNVEISNSKVKNEPLFTRVTFSFCYPIAFATVFMWFQSQGYRLFVDKYLGTESLAGLGVGLGIAASLAGIVESLTTQYIYPKYYLAISTAGFDVRTLAWEKMWRGAFTIYIPCAFATIAVSSILIQLLTANAFHNFSYLVAIGAMIELCRQLTNIVYLVSHSEKKTKANILPYFCGATVLTFGLATLYQLQSLTIINISLLLLMAYTTTLGFNLAAAYRIAKVRFYFTEICFTLLLSLPLLLLIPFLKNIDVISIALALVIGLYALGLIYYQLRNQQKVTV